MDRSAAAAVARPRWRYPSGAAPPMSARRSARTCSAALDDERRKLRLLGGRFFIRRCGGGGSARRRRLGGICHAHGHVFGFGFFLDALREFCFRRLLGAVVEHRACGLAAPRKVRRGHAPGLRSLQIGKHRTARIVCDGGNLPAQRSETESMQGERRPHVPIKSYDTTSAQPEIRGVKCRRFYSGVRAPGQRGAERKATRQCRLANRLAAS